MVQLVVKGGGQRADDHRRKRFLLQATLRTCSSLDIRTAMRRCLQYLGHIMPADWMSLNLYERGLGAVRTIAMATSSEDWKVTEAISPLSQEAGDFLEKSDGRTW